MDKSQEICPECHSQYATYKRSCYKIIQHNKDDSFNISFTEIPYNNAIFSHPDSNGYVSDHMGNKYLSRVSSTICAACNGKGR